MGDKEKAKNDAWLQFAAIFHPGEASAPVIEQAAINHGFDAGWNAAQSSWVRIETEADVKSGRYLATVGLSGMRNLTTCEINRSFGNWYLPNCTDIFHGKVYAICPLPEPYDQTDGTLAAGD